MSNETNDAEPSGASAGSAVNVGGELVSRLRAFNDRLLTGQSFERITRTKCYRCNGTGSNGLIGDYESPCRACGGNGSTERRERIDPSRVIIKDQ